jgi:L-asparaginase
MAIALFVTGGTFDKDYDEITGRLIFRETHVNEMLRIGRCREPVRIKTLMLVDSLDMTEEQRSSIVEECRNCEEERIVITHGTDTMVETAKHLGQSIGDKTIVLTGAMRPYVFGSSDGLFNLGCAIAFAQSLSHGVYITMNGRCFFWDNVRKVREKGEFETIR